LCFVLSLFRVSLLILLTLLPSSLTLQQPDTPLYETTLRINPFDRQEAYATLEGFRQDVLIKGFKNQNRAFDGDVV
jgi:hypothetical protein